MAELLVVVVVVVVVLGYAADRARKLRARARQMSGMNDRLDAAAAKVDEEQQRRRARSRASAELTSVLPAIKRPPLTIPGLAGHGHVPEPEEAGWPAGAPGSEPAPAPADEVPADEVPAGDVPADEVPADEVPTGKAPAPAAPRLVEDTLSMPAADDLPAGPKIQVTTDGTLIMRPVPVQGPAPAGETVRGQDGIRDEPAASRDRANRR